MGENERTNSEVVMDEELKKLLEMKFPVIKEGEIITGKVADITPEYAIIEVGYKTEGLIPISEFTDSEQGLTIKVGDEVRVFVEMIEDEDGIIVLSKEKADKMKVWDDIAKAYDGDGVVEGRVVSKVKGGLTVDIGVKAFLPGSQIDLHPPKELDVFIGKTFRFKVVKFNKKRSNIVLSRRSLLEQEIEELKDQTLKTLEENQEVEGIVKNLTDYGAFVDIGGLDGLLHITDISWKRVTHPSEVLTSGQRIRVKILKYDPTKQKISLGLKQLVPSPWSQVKEKYHIGARVQGRVVSLTDYGAFIELEPGVEGLLHISDMSWNKKVKHPSKILSPGDAVETMVLDMDIENRRISLGLKQLLPNPWDTIEEKFPIGSKVKGSIRSITDFGIFIGVEEGIDGLVHISDISWTQRIKHPADLFKKGQEVEAIVLHIDKENERFSLGIKQLTEDPWEKVGDKYLSGSTVKGSITGITDFGVFLELEPGVEGLIHTSELDMKKGVKIGEVLKLGDELETEILVVDPKNRKLTLSQKVLNKRREKEDIEKYTQDQGSGTPTLGDIMEKNKK